MNVDGHQATDDQIQACLGRMQGAPFTRKDLCFAAIEAGVPATLGESYEGRVPAYRLAGRLIVRENKRGNIRLHGAREWRWIKRRTDNGPAEQINDHR